MTSTDVEAEHHTQHIAARAVRPTDSRLAALLDTKPRDDDVPLEVWWYLAQSLHHSVAVRRAREGVATLGAAALQHQTDRARSFTRAALVQLGDGPMLRRRTRRPGSPSVRMTTRELVCLVVSARPTPLETLREALLAHLDALGSPQ